MGTAPPDNQLNIPRQWRWDIDMDGILEASDRLFSFGYTSDRVFAGSAVYGFPTHGVQRGRQVFVNDDFDPLWGSNDKQSAVDYLPTASWTFVGVGYH